MKTRSTPRLSQLACALALCCLLPVHAAGPAIAAAPVAAAASASTAACPALLRQTFARLQDEAPQNLCQYAGRVLLVVNTASYCGYTSQYEGLEALYARYAGQGLVILGFPSNDFEQEPGSGKEIADFCFNTYGVKFPMFSKTPVSGPQANPFYASLRSSTGIAPKWNFHKYLIDRKGQVVASYVSNVTPDNPKLVADLRRALALPGA